MPSPLAPKRRRISEDGKSSPVKPTSTTTTASSPAKAQLLPSFMTPTKASLAKSYPHLVPKSQPRVGPQRIVSPTRQPPRRSIPPETLTEVVTISNVTKETAIDLAQDAVEDTVIPKPVVVNPAPVTNVTGKRKSSQVNDEEEIERQRGIWMRKLRLLRAECESLEQQLNQARQTNQNVVDAQEKAQRNVNATIQLLLRSNDTALSQQIVVPEIQKPTLPTAAPKKLKNPLPLLRFIHPLTFYSTDSYLLPLDDEVIRHYQLNGYAMERELYFTLVMSVNEKQERIKHLQIKASPWAHAELSPFLHKIQLSCNAQVALTALSTYAKLSSQRSLIFSRLARDLTHLLPESVSSVISLVSRKGKEKEGAKTLPLHRLKRFWLAARSITFQRRALGIVISWDIKFDEAGFAQSHISLSTKIPQTWRDTDDRGILDGLPATFDSLVRRFGVEKGVQTIVRVVFDEA